jgi:hypothetical protein
MRKTSALLVLVLFWGGTATDRQGQASGQVAAVARATNCLEILVRTARDEQPDLQTQEEHCSADADLLAHIGRAKCHQVRIYKNPTAYGLYTVSERLGGVEVPPTGRVFCSNSPRSSSRVVP